MKTLKLVNVACERCSKPLFAFHIGKRETKTQSYGAAMRFSPPRLGVAPRAWAVCECGAETEFDPSPLPGMTGP